MSLTIDSVLMRDEEPRAADLADGVVLLSLRAGSYFGLNAVASDIWQMLASPCRVREIFDALAQQHEVDAATLTRDVTPFLQRLVEERLVRVLAQGDAR